MGRSDILNFWKLLEDGRFSGQPSKLTEDDIRLIGAKLGRPEQDYDFSAMSS